MMHLAFDQSLHWVLGLAVLPASVTSRGDRMIKLVCEPVRPLEPIKPVIPVRPTTPTAVNHNLLAILM